MSTDRLSVDTLIKRLEAATAPDTQLDRAIRDVLDIPAILVPPDGGDEAYPYTGSIDAALTLLPEGFAIRNFMIWPGERSTLTLYGTTRSSDGRYWHNSINGRWNAEAATPALVVCVGALMARMERVK